MKVLISDHGLKVFYFLFFFLRSLLHPGFGRPLSDGEYIKEVF